jgi:hypothetical protein
LQSLGGNSCCQRADNVVCFKTRRVDHGNVEGFAKTKDVGQLRRKIFRHCQAVRFVVGKRLVSKSLLAGFEDGRDVVWLLVLQKLAQHVCEDVDRLGDLPFRV